MNNVRQDKHQQIPPGGMERRAGRSATTFFAFPSEAVFTPIPRVSGIPAPAGVFSGTFP
jgi:hypothetical protein